MDQLKGVLDPIVGVINAVYGLVSGNDNVFETLAKLIGPASSLGSVDWKQFEANLLNLTVDGRKELEAYVVDKLSLPVAVKEKLILGEATLEDVLDLVSNIKKLLGV